MVLKIGGSDGSEMLMSKNVSRSPLSLLWAKSDLVHRHGASSHRIKTPLCSLPHSISRGMFDLSICLIGESLTGRDASSDLADVQKGGGLFLDC